MKWPVHSTTLILISCLSLWLLATTTACVSIHLKGPQIQRAEGLQFTPPPLPFKQVQIVDVDWAWHNPDSQTSISILSECGDVRRLKLDQVEQSLLREMTDGRLVSSKPLTYQGVAARHTQMKGHLDGQFAFYQARLFIKGNCLYLISHVQVAHPSDRQTASFVPANESEYHQFLSDLMVPQ